jgi:hypothetical protein
VENQQQPGPGPEHEALEVIIGKWINEGHTVATEDAQSARIITSDVYERSTGGFFVLHTAYGRAGDLPGGGIEIIGYDAASGGYVSRFFDSRGNASAHELSIEGDTCAWRGESTRCTVIFTDGGRTQTAHHERLDGSGGWVPSMEVVLTKIF